MERINIGILHYRTFDKTIDCISSIQRTTPEAVVYVIDNYSNDGSLELLIEKYAGIPNIHFIRMDNNIGFARANNYCMRMLRNNNEQNVILTNNDIVFDNNSIRLLIKTLNKTKAALVAPKVVLPDGQIVDSVLPTRSKNIYEYIWNKLSGKLFPSKTIFAEKCIEPTIIRTFSGCCFACNLKMLETIDYMDEHTFLYFEEPMLSSRIEDAGFYMMYEPSAKVIHHHGATTSSVSKLANKYKTESQFYYLEKYLGVNHYILKIIFKLKSIACKIRTSLATISYL